MENFNSNWSKPAEIKNLLWARRNAAGQ